MEFLADALIITLVGMGTVFAGLIVIWFIISTFKYISKIEALGKKKEVDKTPSVREDIPETIVEEKEDLELIAVIASVIAMSMNTSVDQLRVRSIKRVTNGQSKWQRARMG